MVQRRELGQLPQTSLDRGVEEHGGVEPLAAVNDPVRVGVGVTEAVRERGVQRVRVAAPVRVRARSVAGRIQLSLGEDLIPLGQQRQLEAARAGV